MTTNDHSPDGLSGLDELWRADPDDADGTRGDQRRRRTARRVGLIITAVVVIILLGVPTVYVAWALNVPLPPPSVTSQKPEVSTPPAAAIPLPTEGAAAISVSGADEYLGAGASGIWTSTGGEEPRPIASISKLITALVVLDAKPLADADDPGPTITFSKADHDLYDAYYVLGATILAMPTGSSMSERTALETLLIPSASNYAEAVSTWAFGSQGAFVSAARRWLAANGLANTTIVEPTGISSRNTSTPSDLLALGRIAAANPIVAQMAATPAVALPTGYAYNTNGLLGTSGITGLKTGNLGAGSFNLLYTASLDVGTAAPLSVTGVALGGYSDAAVDSGVVALLDSIRSGFHTVPLVTGGQDIGSFSTAWGSSADLVVSQGASIFTWSDTPITSTMELTTPTTYEDGEVIGTITWTAGPNTATASVEIEGSIDPPTEWWRLTHPGELGGP